MARTGPASDEADDDVINEQLEQFMKLRQYVQKMQVGTPLLLRTEVDGVEDLRICTFTISSDLHMLKWQDKESDATAEVQIGSITSIEAEGSEDSEHASLTLEIRGHEPMSLICATPEDFVTWRDGLEFLAGDVMGSAGGAAPEPERAPVAAAETSRETEELQRRLRLRNEEISNLKRECDGLREASARKDASIKRLLQEAQNPAAKAESCKTGSSSHESDKHLHQREVIMLQNSNRKLKKAVQAKQETINDLLQLLRRCIDREKVVRDADDGDLGELGDLGAALAALTARIEAQPGVDQSSPTSPSTNFSPVARNAAPQAARPSSSRNAPPPAPEPPNEELESVLSGIASLSNQLNRLERDVAHVADEHSSIHPNRSQGAPMRKAPSPKASPVAKSSTAASAKSSSAAARKPPSPAAAASPAWLPEPPPRAVPARKGGGSAAALKELEREMSSLQGKKNIVEQLARQFERDVVASDAKEDDDDDEDDGFPLR